MADKQEGVDYVVKRTHGGRLYRGKLPRLDLLRQRNEYRAKAVRDSLTGLYNRQYFMNAVTEMDPNSPLAIFYIDIDKFKDDVNDKYGHPAGDKVLRSLSRILIDNVMIVGNGEGPDIAARLGGEEFGVAFPGFTDKEKLVDRANLIRQIFEASYIEEDKQRVKTTISVGVAIRNGYEDPESLLKRADRALYQAKNSGRNNVVVAKEVYV